MKVAELLARLKSGVAAARRRFRSLDVAMATFTRYSDDDGGSLAAALTYFTFFSIFPLLLVAAAVLGYITLGNDELRRQLLEAGVDAAPLLRDVLRPGALSTIEENRNSLALTGLVLALYSGTGGVVALEHALNRINRVEDEGTFVQKRLRALIWLVFLAIAAVASLATSSIAQFAGDVAEQLTRAGEIAALVLGHAGGVLVGLLIFVAAFMLLPRRKRSLREVFPGALAAAIGFEILKVAGSFYLERGESARNDTFGAFAGAAALLVASYLLAQVILLAAELNAVLHERRARRQDTDRLVGEGGAMDEELKTTPVGDGAGPSKSAGELMKEVTQDLSTLVRKEVQLAKEEIGAAVSTKAKGGVIVAVAAVFGLFALVFLLLAVRDGLDVALPTWLADIITGLILLAVGGAAVLVARKKLATPINPELTKKTIKEDVEFAKTLGRR